MLLDPTFPPTTHIIAWAEPTDDGPLYEAIVDGRFIRANSEAAFLEAVYGDNVVVLKRAA